MELKLKFNNEYKVLGLIDLTPKLKLACKELKHNFDKDSFTFLQTHGSEIMNYLDTDGQNKLMDFSLKSSVLEKQEQLIEIDKLNKKGKDVSKLLDKELMADVENLRQTVFNKALDAYKLENQDNLNIDLTKLLIDRSMLTENEITLIETDNTSDFWQSQACKETMKAYDFFRRGGL